MVKLKLNDNINNNNNNNNNNSYYCHILRIIIIKYIKNTSCYCLIILIYYVI